MSKWDTLHRIDGLFVGLLDTEELQVFDEACRRHQARRSYEGAGGLMGLAKVRVTSSACADCGRIGPCDDACPNASSQDGG